jgi:hypothetical protein
MVVPATRSGIQRHEAFAAQADVSRPLQTDAAALEGVTSSGERNKPVTAVMMIERM